MSANQSASEILVSAVQENFRSLLESGYRIVGESIRETPTQAGLELVGSNVGLRFSLDIRDGVVDLYVTKAVKGRAAERGSGEYFDRFTGYLRERRLPWETTRGRQKAPVSLEERIQSDIRAYAEIVANSAPAIANDSETFG